MTIDWTRWTDAPENPLITPPHTWLGMGIIGDPAVVTPAEAPNGETWHLFAWSLPGTLNRYTSADGRAWSLAAERCLPGLRPFVHVEDGVYHLYSERMRGLSSWIELRTSPDLVAWSAPQVVLRPTLRWERNRADVFPSRLLRTTGNPCLVRRGPEDYWLYYSAGAIWFWDTLVFEPKHIGLARGPSPSGPFEKLPDPILSPAPDDPHRNRGAGSVHVLPEPVEGRWIAFNNGIYDDGRTGSSIRVLTSDDGIAWSPAHPTPVVAPDGQEGSWKRAFVYAMNVKRVGDELWLYFNARDGWIGGTERIGLTTLRFDAS